MGLGKTIEVMALVLSHKYNAEAAHQQEEVELISVDGDDDNDEQQQQQQDRDDDQDSMNLAAAAAAAAAIQEDEDESACPCGQPRPRQKHWIECNTCHRWTHIDCAGLSSPEEAEALPSYTCEVCHGLRRFQSPKQVAATLIVTPQLICEQWEEEFANRIDGEGLRVVTYRGVADTQTHNRRLLNPDILGNNYDIVLTTFDILAKDLGHTDSCFLPTKRGESARILRQKKKYRVTPSPLASMIWWRICLDEAQMIESSAAAAAKMALRLKTIHRWCVSGTPIWKGQLDDLYGLLVFLQAAPYDRRSWWRHAIELLHERGDPEAASRLHRLLSGLMWRTSKRTVKDQLALPPQTEITRHLHFSRVERHFYKVCTYISCVKTHSQ